MDDGRRLVLCQGQRTGPRRRRRRPRSSGTPAVEDGVLQAAEPCFPVVYREPLHPARSNRAPPAPRPGARRLFPRARASRSRPAGLQQLAPFLPRWLARSVALALGWVRWSARSGGARASAGRLPTAMPCRRWVGGGAPGNFGQLGLDGVRGQQTTGCPSRSNLPGPAGRGASRRPNFNQGSSGKAPDLGCPAEPGPLTPSTTPVRGLTGRRPPGL